MLDPGGRHLGSGLNEPNGDRLRGSRHFTCVEGWGNLSLCGVPLDTRQSRSIGRVTTLPPNRKWTVGTILDPGGHLLGSGLNESNGDHLRRFRRITCVVGKSHLPTWGGHVSRTIPEVCPCHLKPMETAVGVGHLTPAEPELRDGSCDIGQTRSGGRSHDPPEPDMWPCHVTPPKPEVGWFT